MQQAAANPTTLLYWRVVFWVTCIHLVCIGLVAVSSIFMAAEWEMIWSLETNWTLGAVHGVALWILERGPVIQCLLVLSDIPAIHLIWRWAEGAEQQRGAGLYLAAVFPLGLGLLLGWIGYLYTADTQIMMANGVSVPYVDPVEVASAVVWNVLLLLPAWLMVFGLFAARGRGEGDVDRVLCRGCGYDLRATPERCPECGRR